MNLRRQLLLVSLLTLILPWAGCQFIRETESALREGQQQMLGGTAQAIADSLSQFPYELLSEGDVLDRLYAHPLASEPLIDGYRDEWSVGSEALNTMRGADGPIRFALGQYRQHWYLYAEVRDNTVVYFDPASTNAAYDRIDLVSTDNEGAMAGYRFAAEAPGRIVPFSRNGSTLSGETRIVAHWQDTAIGYSLEARIPRSLVGPGLGLRVYNTDDALRAGVTSQSWEGAAPGKIVTVSPVLQSVAAGYVQPGWRLMITDRDGWRLATVGNVSTAEPGDDLEPSGWLRIIYGLVLEPGAEAMLAEPAPAGRETQSYIARALEGETATRWFRSPDTDRAVVAVAKPIWSGNVQTGVLILQHGTDAILSQTNEALTRLIVLTLTATVLVAFVLLGYASWLSFRIRRLSEAAETALDDKRLKSALPSALADDEVGDLSRSFSSVLRQLGLYNDYLKSLASKLSHELRTPLTIVRSSLENLEHESLSDEALEYTARAREGTERLQKILNAMSEASRTEQLIENAEPEEFPPGAVIGAAVRAYADAWPDRCFDFQDDSGGAEVHGSPELVIQLLDKLVDNAVDFTRDGDTIGVTVSTSAGKVIVDVRNPGPPLPEAMRAELFGSMVSVREGETDEHLGLGLYIAQLIAQGHNGGIEAKNEDNGVCFTVSLPMTAKQEN